MTRLLAAAQPWLSVLPRRRGEWLAAALGVALALPAFAFIAPLPALESRFPVPGNVILDASGGVIERDVTDGARIAVTLDRVAPAMIEATIAAEDQRYWSHVGVDPMAIARAALSIRSDPSGASTLTQQLARAAYLDPALPLWLRKPREALYAVALEARYSKDELLQAYLNEVYYGRGAYGVEAAAQAYFGVSARQLDVAQSAFLAGLPRSPVEYGTPAGSAAAIERQGYVLDRMVATGAIERAAAAEALRTPLRVVPVEPPIARHLSAFVYDELNRVLPGHESLGGLVIETALDAGLQHEAERSVRTRLALLEDHDAGSAAVVVLDPRDGRLLAMVGSADFDAPTGQINMGLEPRQPGSALKPLLYALALERGYTPASMLLDVPATFRTPSGPYRPVNYDLKFRGPAPMRVALASSLNVPAVRTLDALGVEPFVDYLHQAGLDSLEAAETYGLALTLGGGGVRLLDLTAAYGAFARDGSRRQPWVIARVTDQSGNVLYERTTTPALRVTTPQIAFLVADMLSDPAARIPGYGPASILDTPYDAAVKTGTSSEFRDNWTVGFTAERVVGVWVGNPDQSPMTDISGVDGAAPIWRDVMSAAVRSLPRSAFAPPEGLVRVTVCAPTGLLPGRDCPSPTLEWFIEGTAPTTVEHYYGRAADGSLSVAPPVEARAWAVAVGWQLADGDGREAEVALVQPAPGAVLYPAPELGRSAVLLRASVPASADRVEFYVDGAHAGSGSATQPQVEWRLEPGVHDVRIVAYLSTGEQVEARSVYEVRAR